jgi:hypothetical protein
MNKFNSKRLIIALIVGIVVLNIISPVQEMFDFWFNAFGGLPYELVVQKSIGMWMVKMLVFIVVFQVVIPMFVYVILSEIAIKKSNIFIGVIFGLCCFVVGALPQLMFFPLLINVSINFVIVRGIWTLINLVIIGGVIGGIYKPVVQKTKSLIEEEGSAI